MRKELEGFAAMASSCKGGRITIEEFARVLKLPVSPALEELFALFDRVRHVLDIKYPQQVRPLNDTNIK